MTTTAATSASRKRDSHIFDRDKLDHYVEPNWTSERLFEVEGFEGPVLDPCCGWGRIPVAAYKAGHKIMASDIVVRWKVESIPYRRMDFFDNAGLKWFKQARSVVTNPPFDRIEEVARRACEIASHKVALICPLRRLPAARWLQELPLKKIRIMTPRPSMPSGEHIRAGGKVGGGTQDFVWLVFEKGYSGPVVTDWLRK